MRPSLLAALAACAAVPPVARAAAAGGENASEAVLNPRICEVGGSGIVFPIFSGENTWSTGARVVWYGSLLIWAFMGVAIVSDVFMSAIETITSKEKKIRIKVEDTGEIRTFRVRLWNDTVANLTLMALGSSAPEILLSVIELISNDFYSGSLGPSTIVGSAAFNMLIISAVCVAAIPTGEVRHIIGTNVFSCTAFFSVFAYVWLIIILMAISPDKVEIWEGIVTFIMFPLLVILSYLMDKDILFTSKRQAFDKVVAAEECNDVDPKMVRNITAEVARQGTISARVMEALGNIRRKSGPNVVVPKSRARYRIEATRALFMRGKIPQSHHQQVQKVETTKDDIEGGVKSLVMFQPTEYSVMENAGIVELTVHRTDATHELTVKYHTKDGTADQDDYKPVNADLVFAPGEQNKTISIEIIDDTQWEQDETFFVILSNLRCPDDPKCALAPQSVATVTIINDDVPGYLTFTKDEFGAETKSGFARVVVQRKNGCSGVVGCQYTTKDGTGNRAAFAGTDYEATEGKLEFAHEEMEKEILIKLIPAEKHEKNEFFYVELTDAFGGATLDKNTDGGDQKCICEVVLDANASALASQQSMFNFNYDSQWIAAATYGEQIAMAIFVNGSYEAQKEAGPADYVFHLITLPWKLFFATIPPPEFMGGWLCFCVSLMYIGVVTAAVGDIAAALGCVLGIEDEITAITLVALGTSLPDTFASKTAAQQDPYADNSIGNITGSNSVNVFLGLGLPWTIGSIYWLVNFETEEEAWLSHRFKGKTYGASTALGGMGYADTYPAGGFMVPAGNLGASVGIFTACAITCLSILHLRRRLFGGELGGPERPKYLTVLFFVGLWATYILCSIIITAGSS